MAPVERATLGPGLFSLISFSWAALWKLVAAAKAVPILLAPDQGRNTDVGEAREEGEGHGAGGRQMGPGQGQLSPPTQPWVPGQETLLCAGLPTLGRGSPRPGSACAPQLAEAWPLPSLVSLPKPLLALMRNPVISTGEKTSNRKSSRLSLSSALSGAM